MCDLENVKKDIKGIEMAMEKINEEVVNYQAIFTRMLNLCWMFLFTTFLLKIFGLETFNIEIDNERLNLIFSVIDSNVYLRVFINTIITTSGLMLIYYNFINYNKSVFVKVFLSLIFYSVLLNYLIIKGNDVYKVLSLFVYFIPFLSKDYKWSSFVTFITIDNVFMFISALTRGLIPTYNVDGIIYGFVMLIDYYIMWFILCLKTMKGDKEWQSYLVFWLDSLKKKLQNLKQKSKNLLKQEKSVKQTLNVHTLKEKLNTLTKNLKCYAKFKFKGDLKRLITPFIVVFSIYFVYAWCIDKMLEAILLYTAYVSTVYLFPRQFHADYIPNIKKENIRLTCVLLTSLTLCFALSNVVGKSLSVLSAIVIAFCLDNILFVITKKLDYDKKDMQYKKFNLKNCSKEDLLQRCKLKQLSKKDSELAVKIFYDKIALLDLADELVIEYQSVLNKKQRLKNKLMK